MSHTIGPNSTVAGAGSTVWAIPSHQGACEAYEAAVRDTRAGALLLSSEILPYWGAVTVLFRFLTDSVGELPGRMRTALSDREPSCAHAFGHFVEHVVLVHEPAMAG